MTGLVLVVVLPSGTRRVVPIDRGQELEACRWLVDSADRWASLGDRRPRIVPAGGERR